MAIQNETEFKDGEENLGHEEVDECFLEDKVASNQTMVQGRNKNNLKRVNHNNKEWQYDEVPFSYRSSALDDIKRKRYVFLDVNGF